MQKWMFILGCAILLGGDTLQAQTPSREYHAEAIVVHGFDEELWEKAKSDLNYDPIKKKKEESKEDTAVNSPTTAQNNGSSGWDWFSASDGFWQVLFKVLLLILVISFAALLVYRLSGGSLKVSGRSGKSGGTGHLVDIAKVEQNLQKSDMEILIDNALASKNYMLAVRLHYLWVIKELDERRLIRWKRDKTNRDYIRELGQSEFTPSFRQATRIFERIWYGNQNSLAQEEYRPIEKQLREFIQQVKKSK